MDELPRGNHAAHDGRPDPNPPTYHYQTALVEAGYPALATALIAVMRTYCKCYLQYVRITAIVVL